MSEPIQLDLPLNNLVRKSESKDSPSKAIFFLHGFGSNMQDLFGLSPVFDKDWTCISLQASIPVQYNGWAWAELDFENIGKLPKPEQMENHQIQVIDSINKCIEDLYLDPERVNLLGLVKGHHFQFIQDFLIRIDLILWLPCLAFFQLKDLVI